MHATDKPEDFPPAQRDQAQTPSCCPCAGADSLCYRSQRVGPPLDFAVHQLLVDGADGDGRRRLLVRPPADRLQVSLPPQRDLLRDTVQVSVMCDVISADTTQIPSLLRPVLIAALTMLNAMASAAIKNQPLIPSK